MTAFLWDGAGLGDGAEQTDAAPTICWVSWRPYGGLAGTVIGTVTA